MWMGEILGTFPFTYLQGVSTVHKRYSISRHVSGAVFSMVASLGSERRGLAKAAKKLHDDGMWMCKKMAWT